MMMLSWDERGTLVPFSSAEELDRLLDSVCDEVGDSTAPVVVTVLDADDLEGPALSIGCGGPYSVAVWRTPGAAAALLSHGDQPDGASMEFTFCGDPVKYPSSALISNELARAALRTFAATGAQPQATAWQQP